MVIELDGSKHYTTEEAEQYDINRTVYLNQHDIEVLRYSNRDINTRFKEVCNNIDYNVTIRIKATEE